MAVRAEPIGLPATAGEIPFSGEAIAAFDGPGARGVGRPPGHDRARVAEDRAIDIGIEKRRDQRGAVSGERVPADRGVVPGDFLERRHIYCRLDLVAAGRARQHHAEQPEVMHPLQQGRRDPPRALDLVGRGSNFRPKLAGACDRIGAGLDVHAPPPSHASCDPTPRRCQPSLAQGMPCKGDDQPPGIQSITASARVSSVTGTARFRAAAVFRLMTSSNLVGACTGKSAGFAPLRMRST